MEKLLFLAALVMFSMSAVDINLILHNPEASGQPGIPAASPNTGITVNRPKLFLGERFAYAAARYSGDPSIERANKPHAADQHDLACRRQTHDH